MAIGLFVAPVYDRFDKRKFFPKTRKKEVNYHPNKHINAAIEYAIGRCWILKKAGARAHIWGSLYCPLGDRGGCRISVFSTPRVPENHARWIRHLVDRCEHSS